MPVTIPKWRGALVPVFLAAQILLIHAAVGREHPPAPPALSRFPVEFGRWKLFRQDPVAADIARELGADALLSRTYVETPTGSLASLFVAWFQTERGGVRQPHSPKVCLPASGWTPAATDEVTLDTAAGVITVNRYLVAHGAERAAVLYWYQTPRRVSAGEWAAKFWLVADALRDKRTDAALVRVIAWPAHGRDEAATTAAIGFARELYPLLREYLPR
ncbi:MAG: exosortase C-terminal domain/associated protein EpsI [Bryobacteraceae bacterium]|jgi:EpsI family protein